MPCPLLLLTVANYLFQSTLDKVLTEMVRLFCCALPWGNLRVLSITLAPFAVLHRYKSARIDPVISGEGNSVLPAYYRYEALPVLSLYYQASRTVLTLYYQQRQGCVKSSTNDN